VDVTVRVCTLTVNEVEHIEGWKGQGVIDSAGAELGKVDEVLFDSTSGSAVLLAVKSGLLGRHSTLIPVQGATFGRDYVRVAHSQATVDSASQRQSQSSGGTPNREELTALGDAYGVRFPDQLGLETVAEMQARKAEADAARQRAEELAATAREKLDQRDAAGERAMGAKTEADQAQQEAEEARRAALEAREQAQRYEQ